jgi:peptidoglycan/xylan/chitin deacetylase (PgdA/CDA1 family)
MHSVLVYHTIDEVAGQATCPEMISPGRFEQQLEWLSRRRQVVPLIETLSNKNSLVALTFDDGYRDNLTNALPLMEKYSMPATIFVIAGFVNRDGYLSDAELREIAKHPLVTIGSHGLWHRNFNELSETEARFELTESRRTLESIIAQKVGLMSWPYGECRAHLEQLSAECGYAASWSVWKGSNGRHSRWRVPLGARDNLLRFVAKASGVYALTEARWHRYQERGRVRRAGSRKEAGQAYGNARLSVEVNERSHAN